MKKTNTEIFAGPREHRRACLEWDRPILHLATRLLCLIEAHDSGLSRAHRRKIGVDQCMEDFHPSRFRNSRSIVAPMTQPNLHCTVKQNWIEDRSPSVVRRLAGVERRDSFAQWLLLSDSLFPMALISSEYNVSPCLRNLETGTSKDLITCLW